MKEFFQNLKQAWNYSKNQKKLIYLYIFFNVIFIAINLFIPILSAKIIVHLTASKFRQVLLISIVIFFIEIFRNFINKSKNYIF